MQIIKVRFLNNGTPSGKSYTYYSPVNVVVGDTVQINSAATGVVVEVDVEEEEVAAYRDKIKTIVGIVKDTTPETFDPEKAHAAQRKYCEDHNYPHFAPTSRCFRCNKIIYKQYENQNGIKTGISVERAGSELITGCPHCHWSFCE